MKTNFSSTWKLVKIAFLLGITFSLSNCKKDKDDPIIQEQNPLEGYLTAAGYNQKLTTYVNAGDYEFGFSFIPIVNGKITAIVAKIPDVRTGMKVTIWDKATSAILRTELLDMTSSGVEVTKVISALNLEKDKEYFITFNSNDWYDHRKTDGSPATYPLTVGDIKITGYSYKSGALQAIPNSPQLSYYAGDVSFKFQKTL